MKKKYKTNKYEDYIFIHFSQTSIKFIGNRSIEFSRKAQNFPVSEEENLAIFGVEARLFMGSNERLESVSRE